MKRGLSNLALALLLALPAAAQLQQATAPFSQGEYEQAKRLLQPMSTDPQALAAEGETVHGRLKRVS
jgi:hypothetical protein